MGKGEKILALECLWEEAKCYSKLYFDTEDEYKRKKYVSHFRSPIFDETNTRDFKKPYKSSGVLNGLGKSTDEHCNGRTNCSRSLLHKIHNGEITKFNEFATFLVNYCYTIKLLTTENHRVSAYLKKNKGKTFVDAYRDLGIVVHDIDGNVIDMSQLPLLI